MDYCQASVFYEHFGHNAFFKHPLKQTCHQINVFCLKKDSSLNAINKMGIPPSPLFKESLAPQLFQNVKKNIVNTDVFHLLHIFTFW